MKIGTWRLALVGLLATALGACETGEAAEEAGPRLLTVEATRGNLLIRAEATGTVEPVREVEVKSKASGEILRLHVDIGDQVQRGALLAEIDPRDVRNRYNQVQADLEVARARLEISEAQLGRSRQLYEAQVITQQEYESATLDFANARASLVRAETDFNLAELQLADVSITAPMDGTIIQKNVEEGTVIQSASSNVSGGTALFIMADLSDMQVRTLVDETDMGKLMPGLETAVRVEAFADRTFRGVVEKIEPLALEEQNVTMFPVIVTLDNRNGLLKPGMNAEVEIFIDEARDVVLVPNNAIVQTADVGPAAMALGLDIDRIDLSLFMPSGGGRAGFPGGGRQGGAQAEQEDRPAESPAGGQDPGAPGARAGSGATEPGAEGAAGPALSGTPPSRARGARSFGNGEGEGARETRPAAVFVMGADGVPEPRLVQLGLGDWDNTQVVSGVEAGETLVVVGAAQLQARQQEFLDRMRSRGGGSPFGGGFGGRGR